MVAAHRGHIEMVYLLLKDGKADTTLEDAYGKKAIDRAQSSHISYLITTASIENRMKDVSGNLNVIEYSPEKGTAYPNSRSVSRGKGGVPPQSALSMMSPGDKSLSPNSRQHKSILMTSGKKMRGTREYSPQKLDPRLQTI